MAYEKEKGLPGEPSKGPALTGKGATPGKPANMLEAMKRRSGKC